MECPKNSNSLTESGLFDDLIADGYIFVSQNIRGRFKSEGTFIMQRPPRDKDKNSKSVDESTDAYDTIDWLVKNLPNNNGRVGMWGISYPGWLVTQALLDPHPALKAASEQASPDDMFINDDFHHNGAFRLSYGFEYSALLESSKEKNTNFEFDQYDTYALYLGLGARFQCEPALLPGQATHLERLRRASQPRFLEAAFRHRLSEAHDRAQPERRRLVRPGRLRGPDSHLRDSQGN